MADLSGKIRDIYSLEQLSSGHTVIHRLHPGAKLLATAVLIITVVSFPATAFSRMIPYVFYPVILMALSETPWTMIGKRLLLALPFVAVAAVSNLLLMPEPAFYLGTLAVSQGVVSFFVLLYRTVLCVSTLLILVAVTPVVAMSNQLRRVHVPEVLVMLFEMTYRYIGALLEQASHMYTAYTLRHTQSKGLELRHMGPFVGNLLLKSFDRAERVYGAMCCRGYGNTACRHHSHGFHRRDWIFVLLCCGGCIALRFVDVMAWVGQWMEGWG